MAFQQFEPVSFSTLKEIIDRLRSCSTLHDILPSRIIKEADHYWTLYLTFNELFLVIRLCSNCLQIRSCATSYEEKQL